MLLESRLYSFIDQKEGFSLHFLEGQKLVHDLALIHKVEGKGFQYFRDTILSIELMISYLKAGEGLGIYIDSDEPYFRFKAEMSEQGQMRTLLLPENFNQFPRLITGKCRVVKTLPNESSPYSSVVELNQVSPADAINLILKNSYQLNSKIFLSDLSDQSLMLLKLPEINVDKIQTNYTLSIDQYFKKIESFVYNIYSTHTMEYDQIVKSFENLNLVFLGSKEVKFNCTCSRERIEHGIWSLIKSSGLAHVFHDKETSISTKCDYCKSEYHFKKEEFLN